jgi:hypothetical protein
MCSSFEWSKCVVILNETKFDSLQMRLDRESRGDARRGEREPRATRAHTPEIPKREGHVIWYAKEKMIRYPDQKFIRYPNKKAIRYPQEELISHPKERFVRYPLEKVVRYPKTPKWVLQSSIRPSAQKQALDTSRAKTSRQGGWGGSNKLMSEEEVHWKPINRFISGL